MVSWAWLQAKQIKMTYSLNVSLLSWPLFCPPLHTFFFFHSFPLFTHRLIIFVLHISSSPSVTSFFISCLSSTLLLSVCLSFFLSFFLFLLSSPPLNIFNLINHISPPPSVPLCARTHFCNTSEQATVFSFKTMPSLWELKTEGKRKHPGAF